MKATMPRSAKMALMMFVAWLPFTAHSVGLFSAPMDRQPEMMKDTPPRKGISPVMKMEE